MSATIQSVDLGKVRGDDGAVGPRGPEGPAGATGERGQNGQDGHTPTDEEIVAALMESESIDATPTQNSDNLVKSGGVYGAINPATAEIDLTRASGVVPGGATTDVLKAVANGKNGAVVVSTLDQWTLQVSAPTVPYSIGTAAYRPRWPVVAPAYLTVLDASNAARDGICLASVQTDGAIVILTPCYGFNGQIYDAVTIVRFLFNTHFARNA